MTETFCDKSVFASNDVQMKKRGGVYPAGVVALRLSALCRSAGNIVSVCGSIFHFAVPEAFAAGGTGLDMRRSRSKLMTVSRHTAEHCDVIETCRI